MPQAQYLPQQTWNSNASPQVWFSRQSGSAGAAYHGMSRWAYSPMGLVFLQPAQGAKVQCRWYAAQPHSLTMMPVDGIESDEPNPQPKEGPGQRHGSQKIRFQPFLVGIAPEWFQRSLGVK